MHIERIKLINYRNYAALELTGAARLVMLSGDNAQGKTNLVEAIYLLAAGRSHRTPRESELIRHGEAGAYARVDFARDGTSRRVELKLYRNGKKQGKVDGAPVQRMGDLIGKLNAVIFSPEDLRLVKGGPGERRRFMDMEISQMRPRYFAALSQYSRALLQRNALLKDIAAGKSGDALEEYDALLAEAGVQLIAMRGEFVEKLSALGAQMHGRISGGEALSMQYRPDVEAEGFAQLMRATRQEDVRRGATGRGPHKDDIAFFIAGQDARYYASQGQQRTAALALKLAETELMKDAAGEYPVFLLDDVMSELDESRQQLLVKAIAKCQTFITCTQVDKRLAAQAEVYKVRCGQVRKI